MAKRRWRIGIIAGALVAVAAFVWILFPRPQTALTPDPPGARLTAASQGLDTITIDATFRPVSRSMDVTQICVLQNRTGVAQRLAVLRTYPNAFSSEDTSPAATDELYDVCYPNGFSAGKLSFSYVMLQMADAAEDYASYSFTDDAHTVMSVALPADWLPGESITLRIAYTLTVPEAIYRYGVSGGVWALGNAFVIPSPWQDGEYRTDEYISIGDPFISECRNYTVRLTAPKDYIVAGTGASAQAETADGQTLTTFTAPAVRDFALCVSTAYREQTAKQNGVLVRALALTDANAKTMLTTALRALACFADRYGAYPYPTYTLCEASLPIDAAEYPALSMVSSAKLAAQGDAPEQAVALQTAHQWWYAVVGSDGFNQAWQDEALSQFSLLDYWETYRGASARADLQYSLADTAMLVTVPQGVTPGSPVDYFGDPSEYRLVVYGRGAAAMCALNTALNGTLDGFLRAYYDTYAFRLATRADFETLLKTHTGEDWSPLLTDYLDTYLSN